MMQCPKCQYTRKASDIHVHTGICPACGIAYQKWLDKHQAAADLLDTTENIFDDTDITEERFFLRLLATFIEAPNAADPTTFWARATLLTALVIWWGLMAMHGINWEVIGGSFMHSIDLAFHEFGHVLFSPFGTLMMFLGGSLFQILLPLIPLVVFTFQQRDNFSAAIMLAWCGQNFIDVAPYIRDAEYRALPLVGNATEANHDWGNILTMLNAVQNCYALANTSFAIGVIVMCVGFLWAMYILHLQYRVMQKSNC